MIEVLRYYLLFFVLGSFSDLLIPPTVDAVRIPRDADAFRLEHARDGPGAAADLDFLAAQSLEGFDAGPIDETDVGQIETHRAPGSKKIGAFALQQGGPLGDDAPLELERRQGA